MKRWVLVVVSGALLGATAYGLSPYSFRLKGMGPGLLGFVGDDYSDIYYNPAYVTRLEGLNIYTNLSNLQKFGNDHTFAQTLGLGGFNLINLPYSNLVGVIGGSPQLKGGAILESSGLSFGIAVEEETVDPHEFGIDSLCNKYELTGGSGSRSAFLIGGMKLGGLTIGGSIFPNYFDAHYKYENDYRSSSYDTAGALTYHLKDFVSAEYKFKAQDFGLKLGGVIGEASSELGLTIGITPASLSLDGHYLSDYFEFPWWDSASYQDAWKNDFEFNLGGTDIGMELRKRTRGDEGSLSILGGMDYLRVPVDLSYYDSTYTFYRFPPDTTQLFETVINQAGSGSGNFFNIACGLGGERYFDFGGLRTISALGVKLGMILGNMDAKLEPERRRETYYHFIDDDDPTNDEGCISEINTNETISSKGNGLGIILEIPAGLETHLTEKLVLRLGSRAIIPLYLSGKWETELIDAGYLEHRHYTHGPDAGKDTTIVEPSEERDSAHYELSFPAERVNLTSYHFGLGYRVNDAVELDILNFAQLTDLRTWLISVRIRY